MIMGRTAGSPGQSGQNGHVVRARGGGGERLSQKAGSA
jgi:hypothetical protein